MNRACNRDTGKFLNPTWSRLWLLDGAGSRGSLKLQMNIYAILLVICTIMCFVDLLVFVTVVILLVNIINTLTAVFNILNTIVIITITTSSLSVSESLPLPTSSSLFSRHH